GDDPAPHPEQQHGQELEADGDTDVEAAARQGQDEPTDGDGLHPRPDQRNLLADEEQAVVAALERLERPRSRQAKPGHSPVSRSRSRMVAARWRTSRSSRLTLRSRLAR